MATPNSHFEEQNLKNNTLQLDSNGHPQEPQPEHRHAETGNGKGKAVVQASIQTQPIAAKPDQELTTVYDVSVSSQRDWTARYAFDPYSGRFQWYGGTPTHMVFVRIMVLAGNQVLLDNTVWWKASELRRTFTNPKGGPLRAQPDDYIETFSLDRLRSLCARITSLPLPGCGERIGDKEVWGDLRTATVGITHGVKETTIFSVFQFPASKILGGKKPLKPVRELSVPFTGFTENFILRELQCRNFGGLAKVQEFFKSTECKEHADALQGLRA